MKKKHPIFNIEPFFRGWAKPGPLPCDEVDGEVDEGETVDALAGHFRIFQLKGGHRFSTDDVMCAWYATSWAPSVKRALDLGSGLGSVAMLSAWRLRGASFVTVEAQEVSYHLAKKSVAYNGLTDRFDVRLGDFRDGTLADDERFDLITGSPPYFDVSEGPVSEHPQKLACRFEMRGTIHDYCDVAAKHLASGGWFCCVFPIEPPFQKQRVFDAAEAAGLTIVRWRSVVLREGDTHNLGLFGMVKTSDLPEVLHGRTYEEPPIILRRTDGTLDPEIEVIRLSFGFPPGR